VKNSSFDGLVRLGAIHRAVIEHHDTRVPVGIYNSRLIACDIGDDCAILDCAYLAHYIVGDGCILLNNDEIEASNHAKFGNGIIMDGESEEVRITLDIMNEAGGRAVLPFNGMRAADAYLWARRRGESELQEAFKAMTERMFDKRRGRYGSIGDNSILKSNRIIKDVAIGPCAYIKGANKLKNLTVNSSDEARTQIGEGVELVNGIIGYGCRIFYGCKAVRFVIGDNSALKYGARLIHSFLGENSTVSCCEILNNLIFPSHEQHHNTSFLIASLVRGQSNMAAGATIGSNHNSRANDGEIEAGRGFWPGLSTSVKHSSRFASFCLLAKGDYRSEIDLPLPFCLVDDDRTRDRLVLLPAYWWLYDLYALLRNETKFQSRDKRSRKETLIEYSPFAPDTAEEIIAALGLLEEWTGPSVRDEAAAPAEVRAEGIENSGRPTVVKRPARSYRAYREMLLWYGASAVLDYAAASAIPTDKEGFHAALAARLGGVPREARWENLGGQLVSERSLEGLLSRVAKGEVPTWRDMHREYAKLAGAYPLEKARHAWAVLAWLAATEGGGPCGARAEAAALGKGAFAGLLGEFARLSERVEEGVYLSRKKDYENKFRRATFRSDAEAEAVLGSPESNSFVLKTRKDLKALRDRAGEAIANV
jgi:NDP-sugar pyrophosphorylase family protein